MFFCVRLASWLFNVYHNLNLLCVRVSVLDFEPNNITAKEFYPLIEGKLRRKCHLNLRIISNVNFQPWMHE